MRQNLFLGTLIGLALLAQGGIQPAAAQQVLPVLRLGDRVGNEVVQIDFGNFQLGSLNDAGQIALVTPNEEGGELLLQYVNGQWLALVFGGGPTVGGRWPRTVGVLSPVSMNQGGSIAFAADVTIGGFDGLATFLWDMLTRQIVPVLHGGIAEVYDITFEHGGNWLTVLNNPGDIALVSTVRTGAGDSRSGDFILTRDGVLMPIALPDQVLPDGSTCLDACNPTINDSGVVGFVVQRQGDPLGAFSAYQWREEVITPVAVVGQQLPDGERIGSVFGVWVNNHDSNIMLAIQHAGATDGSYFLYRYVEGQIVPLVGPGHTMPGGGNLRRLQDFGVSFPNDLGQHAFLARLDDGTTAAYLLDADGTLTRLLASGLTTDDGTITNVGEGAGLSSGLALNGLGQIAVTVRFGTGLDTVVLVSPP